jgi:prepilin-type N-terminal cleavage/methylation domain-containing protein
MFRQCHNPTSDVARGTPRASGPRRARAGLTLVELMVAAAIMAIIVTALAALANAVYVGADYSGGHGEAVQNARVTLERITRLANEATASPQFPGILLVPRQQSGRTFPDTVVIWHPASTPFDPAGLPRFNELVIFCPNASRPNELIELTAPGDTRTVPEYTNLSGWISEIDALKNSTTARRILLTNLVRTASADGSVSAASRRACVRFNVRYHPSDANLTDWKNGNVTWEELPWVQNIYSHSLGLRQVWLRIELQLMPGSQAKTRTSGSLTAIPFFDSASMHYTLKKTN